MLDKAEELVQLTRILFPIKFLIFFQITNTYGTRNLFPVFLDVTRDCLECLKGFTGCISHPKTDCSLGKYCKNDKRVRYMENNHIINKKWMHF